MEILTGNGIEVLLRWLHVLAGITWIGVLYYLNFIQTPFFGTELGGTAKSAMTRGLVPNALWWFRWGAMFTFLSGWTIVFYRWGHLGIPLSDGYMTKILTGGVMGTLMWFNVWFLIWPAQQVVIANALKVAGGEQPIPEAAARAGKAAMYSRTNVVFSIPMVFYMVSAMNLPGFLSGTNDLVYWIAALVIIGAVEVNSLIGPGKPTQKPLTTVRGAIHMGLGLWLVLYVVGSVLNS